MRRIGSLLVALLLVTALLPATAAGAAFGGLSQQSVDPDVVVMTADVQADGDAQWAVAYRIRLATDNDTQAFEELQADIRANETAYTDRFGDRMAGTARAAENATGREMAIENVSVTARQESFGQTYGVVTYRFRWTNFAATEDGRLTAGDALSGLFLDSETSLTMSWPAGYSAQTVAPAPDDRSNTSATWRGQQQFGTDEPRVVLAQTGGGGGDGGLDTALVGGAVLVVLALVGGAYWARRSGLFGGGDEGDEPVQQPTAASEGGDGDTTTDTDSAAAAGAAGNGASAPPAELLSNEEQVLKLLNENGGRIKQQEVASRLDWTDAKTSQVIGGLREDDELETFRIGRENVVTLPDTDVTETTDDENGE
ncbi:MULTISPECIES: helix-turn-helix transcriptional regulator [Haloarcula]|uniref:DUF4897 domain-containing protein n=1 Tax=Haloarcula pellucida TaxID=1427151 RepID=A0A830GQK2_9EURY|nr:MULTISPECIES: hypothetical protein [Halomicroarcula]MBX0349467.1 hypothetical protein [Halomicroarcula pellucida]MDS0278950.1 hypothetical protein [Halomicroarcula sp. S1AR25-4]GGO02785.1 hypothetical protein GCM10009030_37760 [Halomicroarcula pellucida]